MIVFCGCDRKPLFAGIKQLWTIRVISTSGEVGRLAHTHKAGNGEEGDGKIISCQCAGSAERIYSFGF